MASYAPKGHTTSYWAPTRVTSCSCLPSRDKYKAVKPTRATHGSQQPCKAEAYWDHPQAQDRDLQHLPVHPGREVPVLPTLRIFRGKKLHSKER